jgi:hypothetical protein
MLWSPVIGIMILPSRDYVLDPDVRLVRRPSVEHLIVQMNGLARQPSIPPMVLPPPLSV